MEAGDRAMQGAIAERTQSKSSEKLTTIPRYQVSYNKSFKNFYAFVYFAFFASLH
jgi:hypothetical protein